MGIRYYAYTFDADATESALADPRSVISADPLADAWGLPPGAMSAVTDFVQPVPKSEMLYLDKAWSALQALTAPASAHSIARPSHRMFEGRVTPVDLGWISWSRAITPDEVPLIAADLVALQDELTSESGAGKEDEYVLDFLHRAVEFVRQVAATGRGFAYLIG